MLNEGIEMRKIKLKRAIFYFISFVDFIQTRRGLVSRAKKKSCKEGAR